MNDSYPFVTGDRVQKRGGDYEATGEVLAVFRKRDGTTRLAVEFDVPLGLVFIMRPDQVTLEQPDRPMQQPVDTVAHYAPGWESTRPDWSAA